MAKFQRTARNEFPSTDSTRIGKTDVSYVYMNLETFATYTFTIPLEEDTEEHVRAILTERVARAAAAGPATVEI
jgi:hypothetical protein